MIFISRVSVQSGVSLLYTMLEIRHSGREPSIWTNRTITWSSYGPTGPSHGPPMDQQDHHMVLLWTNRTITWSSYGPTGPITWSSYGPTGPSHGPPMDQQDHHMVLLWTNRTHHMVLLWTNPWYSAGSPAWSHRASVGTGWSGVSMLGLAETALLSQCGSTYNCLSRSGPVMD